ncbi:hypothetical protein MUS1_03210 [Marinomonas ushuaiensis DSM 15871]|uniref:DUF2914 domain-containing protein n=1 Tax=Marinomonas ushuaiensis DSM 15871 TaxID=1122207 RepID=X7E9I5_9GAMM|nr:DUF2914 domain-containing protein [Marinomonas ushuaiensis]ETX12607.1 hypothetical protein MUS1_03210 [Marinomonas ushuaiensis DSM 15871]
MCKTLVRAMVASALMLVFSLPAWAEGTIARAQFSTDVIDREPIDDIGPTVKVEYGEIQKVYFFTDLRDMSGTRVVHRWTLDGDSQAEVAFDIGGDRWRVWSSKRLLPGFDGKWAVEIVQDGEIIETRSFDYVDDY